MNDVSLSLSFISFMLSFSSLIASFFTHNKVNQLIEGHKLYGRIENNSGSMVWEIAVGACSLWSSFGSSSFAISKSCWSTVCKMGISEKLLWYSFRLSLSLRKVSDMNRSFFSILKPWFSSIYRDYAWAWNVYCVSKRLKSKALQKRFALPAIRHGVKRATSGGSINKNTA